MRKLKLLSLFTLPALLVAFVAGAATTNVVVTPSNMQDWGFLIETGTDSVGEIVAGPGTPPFGDASARLQTVNSADGIVLGKLGYGGTKLADLEELVYSTYRSAGGDALAISLQFNIDADVTDADDTWQGRLVFEPYYTETVETGEWQTWDTMNQGKWWGTGAVVSAECSIGSPCTFDEVLSAFPNIGVHNTLGAVLFRAGSGWAGFDGNVDGLKIGLAGDVTIYDFELDPVINDPSDKDECKDGGWMDFGFKNQGQCIRFVNTDQDSR